MLERPDQFRPPESRRSSIRQRDAVHMRHVLESWTAAAERVTGALVPDVVPPLPAGIPGDPGYFGPDSVVWEVARERVLVAGGPAALLLQIAHPLVAAGVTQHSNFREEPFQRLNHTLATMLVVVFGDHEQAASAARRVEDLHERVHGRSTRDTGEVPAGTPYSATDPDLLLWVFATLVETALASFAAFVRPVTPEERDAYYLHGTALATLFGVPRETLPKTYEAFKAFYVNTCDDLVVGHDAQEIARVIFGARLSLLPVSPLGQIAAAAFLPASLRDGYGLRWERDTRLMFASVAHAVRRSLPLVPPAIRYWQHWRAGLQRTGKTAPGEHSTCSQWDMR